MVVMLALIGWPMAAIGRFVEVGYVPRGVRLAQYAGFAIAAIALTIATHRVPMRMGERALERTEG